MRIRSTCVMAVAMLGTILGSQHALACGEEPWAPPGFVRGFGPEDLEAFAAGRLGIVLQSYARSYLVVAYRTMMAKPLTEAEQAGALQVWKTRLKSDAWVERRRKLQDWLNARGRICGPEGNPGSAKSQIVEDVDAGILRYQSFYNCYPDAFETAAARLEELIAQHGPTSPETLDWLAAQDAVFRNCSSREMSSPSPAARGTAEECADRDYQLAAAWFYAGNFDLAEAGFRSIARDSTSRWRTLAPYLVVRCLVRRGEIEWKNRASYLSQALVEIDEFLRDKTSGPLHPAANRVKGIILRRFDPDRRTPELADLIAQGERPDEFAENLWDLTQLLDLYEYSPGRPWTDSIQRPDLIAWLRDFQYWGPSHLENVLAKWHQTRSAPWLVAALAHIRGIDPAAGELLDAAADLERQSAAWPTVEYHRLRLLVEQSRVEEARRGLDAALLDPRFGGSGSAENIFRGLRARVARDRRDFLSFAVRSPVSGTGGSYSEMGRLVKVDAPRLAETAIAETLLPLSEQRTLVDEPSLDEPTRERLAAAVWVRAILLRRLAVARQVTPHLQPIIGRLRSQDGESEALNVFLTVRTEEQAYREAIFVMLHLPGMEPFFSPRLRDAGELYHGSTPNWWAGWQQSWSQVWNTMSSLWGVQPREPADGAYPLAPLRAKAEEERGRLAALGSPLTVMGREILSWARRAPDDPRMPKMLRDLIIAGRYTSGDEYSTDILQQAFRLLHSRYKNTKWAGDTPYWYQPFQVTEVDPNPRPRG